MEIQTELNLYYPQVLSGQKYLIEYDLNGIEKQLEAIDYSNLKEALLILKSMAYELNRCPQSAKELQYTTQVLSKRHQLIVDNMLGPIEVRSQLDKDLFELVSALTLELSYSYKRLVNSLISENSFFSKSKKIAKAISSAIYYLTLYQVERYQLSKALPNYLWQEFNSLYSYAETNKLDEIEGKAKSKYRFYPASTIQKNYIRAILLSGFDPYILEPGEYWELLSYLERLIPHAKLVPFEHFNRLDNSYLVAIDSEQEPFIHKKGEPIEASSQTRVLLLNSIIELLNEDASQLNKNPHLISLGFFADTPIKTVKTIFNQLHKLTTKHVARRYERYPITSNVVCLWGFKACIRTLHNLQKSLPFELEQQKLRYEHSLKFHLNWQAVNESVGGLCLEISDNLFEEKVDRLVLFNKQKQNLSDSSAWELGIVRWIKKKDFYAKIGIERFSGKVRQAVYLEGAKKHPVLLVGPDKNKQYQMLISKSELQNKNNIRLSILGNNKIARVLEINQINSFDIAKLDFNSKFKK